MLVAVNLDAPHTITLVLSWVVPPIFLLAVVPFTTSGRKAIQRRLCEREMRAARRVALAVLAVLWALIAFFPLGGYRVLPTKWENCFVQGGQAGAGWLGGDVDHGAFPGGTPCGKLSGEQGIPYPLAPPARLRGNAGEALSIRLTTVTFRSGGAAALELANRVRRRAQL